MNKAFIMDLDGTLLDSMDVWHNIAFEYLRSKGIQDIGKNLAQSLKTMDFIGAAQYFISEYGINLAPRLICNEINDLLADKYKYDIDLKDGVLDFLLKHQDIKMCIATATERPLVELALEKHEISNFFDFIITSTEVGKCKTSPDIYIQASKQLGTSIENIIVFEDAYHAIKSSKLAGFYTVGVYEKQFEKDKDKIIALADKYVYSLKEWSL